MASKRKRRFEEQCPSLSTDLMPLLAQPTSGLPEEVQNMLQLYRCALHKKANAAESAYEIGRLYELGGFPAKLNISRAITWHKYGLQLGNEFSTLRLIDRCEAESSKVKYLKILIMQVCRRTIKLGRQETQELRMIVARLIVKLHELLSPKNMRAGLFLLDDIKSDEAKILRADINQLLGRTGKPARESGPAYRVLKSKIQADGDFKAGIYKVLEEPLPVRQVPADLDIIEETLNAEFPWFTDANKTVMRQLRIRQMAKDKALTLKPLLLVGLPGLGKTTWARRLAELLDLPVRILMAAGSSDSMYLRGTPRGWASARPGAVLEAMAVEQLANPMFIIDEIDKASSDNRNGRIWDVLLQLLEPASNKVFLDECLGQPCDLSRVSWIATANSLQKLPEPLLSRFTVVLVKSPSKDDLIAVAEGVRKQMAAELGMDVRMLSELNGDEVDLLMQCRDPREVSRVTREILESSLLAKRKMRMH